MLGVCESEVIIIYKVKQLTMIAGDQKNSLKSCLKIKKELHTSNEPQLQKPEPVTATPLGDTPGQRIEIKDDSSDDNLKYRWQSKVIDDVPFEALP